MGQYFWKALHQTAEAHSAAGNNSTHLDLEVGYKLPHNKFSTTNITSSKNTRSLTNIKRKKIEKYITAAWHKAKHAQYFYTCIRTASQVLTLHLYTELKACKKKKEVKDSFCYYINFSYHHQLISPRLCTRWALRKH
jgi:hypothetical protein